MIINQITEKVEKKNKEKENKFEGFFVINSNAAGIDIGSRNHWVCIPKDKEKNNIREFGTFTCDLVDIVNWLKENNVTTVAMESTGVYWIPLFQMLSAEGFDVCLANARHLKGIPGRLKTDKIDCAWIQKLHSCGLLRASFRPDDNTCQLRTLLRHRDNLIKISTTNTLHMLKSLELMNLKINNVVSDITGATSINIIKAILDGEHDSKKLLKFKDKRIKSSDENFIKALNADYRNEHLVVLKLAFDAFVFTKNQIAEIDIEIKKLIEQILDKKVEEQITFDFFEPKKKINLSHNSLYFDAKPFLFEMAGVNLTEIPGLKDLSVLNVISEIGTDMSKWETSKHFTSWLGLAPNQVKSGGVIFNSSTKSVINRASIAFRTAANSIEKTHTYLGAFFRDIRYRAGRAVAITAVARKIAVIFYSMIKNKSRYIERGELAYKSEKDIRYKSYLEKKLKKFGLKAVPI